jgi:hypothetical protein
MGQRRTDAWAASARSASPPALGRPVLQGIDPGGDGPGPGQRRAVGGHRGPAGMGGLDPLVDLVGGEKGAAAVGAVQVQLDQVGAGIELAEGGGQEPVPVVDLDRQPAGRLPVRASQPPATRT